MDGISATLISQHQFDSLLTHHIVVTFIQEGLAPAKEQLAREVPASVENVESPPLRRTVTVTTDTAETTGTS